MNHKKHNPGGIKSTKSHGGIGDRFTKADQELPSDKIPPLKDETDSERVDISQKGSSDKERNK